MLRRSLWLFTAATIAAIYSLNIQNLAVQWKADKLFVEADWLGRAMSALWHIVLDQAFALGCAAAALVIVGPEIFKRTPSAIRAVRQRRKTGLIPIRFVESPITYGLIKDGVPGSLPYKVGDIAGFTKAVATRLTASGLAEYVWLWDRLLHRRYAWDTRIEDILLLRPPAKRALSAIDAPSTTLQGPIVINAYLYLDPPGREAWRGQAKLNRNTAMLRICLEYSAHSGGMGEGFWSKRTRIPVRQIKDASQGQDITFPVAALDQSEPNRFWRWAISGDEEAPLVSPVMSRCRIVFIGDDDVEYYFNFISLDHQRGELLRLIGEHHFQYAQEWEAETSQS
ncbi:MAG TPA: hypothetical protein VF601_17250 [Beijerinckiaceae bacterium]|jgi:hypothetical protein